MIQFDKYFSKGLKPQTSYTWHPKLASNIVLWCERVQLVGSMKMDIHHKVKNQLIRLIRRKCVLVVHSEIPIFTFFLKESSLGVVSVCELQFSKHEGTWNLAYFQGTDWNCWKISAEKALARIWGNQGLGYLSGDSLTQRKHGQVQWRLASSSEWTAAAECQDIDSSIVESGSWV